MEGSVIVRPHHSPLARTCVYKWETSTLDPLGSIELLDGCRMLRSAKSGSLFGYRPTGSTQGIDLRYGRTVHERKVGAHHLHLRELPIAECV